MNSDKVETIETTVLPLTKNVLSLISGVGVGRIVSGVVDMAAPQTKVSGKIFVYVAKVGISGAINAAVDKNNNSTIDTVFNTWKKFVTPESSQA